MKRGTPRHKKMHQLAEALKVPLFSAVGIMEMLWHYASDHTPEGDIGAVSDIEIASAVSWNGRPNQLVDALVQCRWVHRSEVYRLFINDWPDHCDQWVKKKLVRNRKDFLPVYRQNLVGVQSVDIQGIDGGYLSRGLGVASQQMNSGSGGGPEGDSWARDLFASVTSIWEKPCEICNLQFPMNEVSMGWAELLALVDSGRLTEREVPEVLDGLARWRYSRDWHKDGGKYVFSVAKFFGWRRDDPRSTPRWRDRPVAANCQAPDRESVNY